MEIRGSAMLCYGWYPSYEKSLPWFFLFLFFERERERDGLEERRGAFGCG